MSLQVDSKLTGVDTIYECLIAMHAGLDDEQSHRANARLILILANQLGDEAAVLAAIAEARGPSETERN